MIINLIKFDSNQNLPIGSSKVSNQIIVSLQKALF